MLCNSTAILSEWHDPLFQWPFKVTLVQFGLWWCIRQTLSWLPLNSISLHPSDYIQVGSRGYLDQNRHQTRICPPSHRILTKEEWTSWWGFELPLLSCWLGETVILSLGSSCCKALWEWYTFLRLAPFFLLCDGKGSPKMVVKVLQAILRILVLQIQFPFWGAVLRQMPVKLSWLVRHNGQPHQVFCDFNQTHNDGSGLYDWEHESFTSGELPLGWRCWLNLSLDLNDTEDIETIKSHHNLKRSFQHTVTVYTKILIDPGVCMIRCGEIRMDTSCLCLTERIIYGAVLVQRISSLYKNISAYE